MRQLLTAALLVFIFVGCKKDKDEEDHSAQSFNFSSYHRYDINGNYLGSIGNTTDEKAHEDWPDWVFDAFAPLDSINLTGYQVSEVTFDKIYPNPAADTQNIQVFATQPVNLKLLLVDNTKKVYYLRSIHVPAAIQRFGISYANLNMPAGTNYRMFYGFSAEGKPFFKRGHVDIAYKIAQ